MGLAPDEEIDLETFKAYMRKYLNFNCSKKNKIN